MRTAGTARQAGSPGQPRRRWPRRKHSLPPPPLVPMLWRARLWRPRSRWAVRFATPRRGCGASASLHASVPSCAASSRRSRTSTPPRPEALPAWEGRRHCSAPSQPRERASARAWDGGSRTGCWHAGSTVCASAVGESSRVTACCSRSDCDGGSTRRWSQSPRLLPPARMCARRQQEPMLCTRPAWAVRAASLQLMLPTPLRMVGRGRLRRRRGSAPRDDPFLPGVHNRPSPRPQPRPLPLPRRPSASSSCQTRTASRRRSPLTRRCFLGCRPRPPPPRAARKLRRPVRPTARRLLLQWASLCQRGTCFCISGILLSTAGRGIGSRLSSVSTLGYRCSDSTTNLSCAATTTRSTSRSRAPTPRSSPSPLWQPSAAGPSRSSPSPEAAALSYPPAT
mmetsp:Transcript_3404/g.11039  ORF Transcript_3404/g.11039 Transcript_3404/m.11039 type:complete len:395 (+) Transcript_3404:673-1857(+)